MAFPADSPLVAAVRPSPNHGERASRSPGSSGRGLRHPDHLVLHYTGMVNGAAALDRLCLPEAEVSAHYVVLEDGAVLQLVPESRRAHHAGRGSWAGETDLNSASIGVEIVNGGHDFGLPPFPDRQIAAVIALARDVAGRHGIPPEHVLAHSDLAPTRKLDPGELFPWQALARAGIGLWVPPDDDATRVLVRGGSSEAVRRFQMDLARWGYGIAVDGAYGDATAAVVRAFQRRHRPSIISGDADAGTLATLARLMTLRFTADQAAVRSTA